MLDKIAALFGARNPFAYTPGVPSGIGTGTERMGFNKPQSDPLYWPVPPDRAVRGCLRPQEGGYNYTTLYGPSVSLVGSGAYLTGALDLQALASFEAAQKG